MEHLVLIFVCVWDEGQISFFSIDSHLAQQYALEWVSFPTALHFLLCLNQESMDECVFFSGLCFIALTDCLHQHHIVLITVDLINLDFEGYLRLGFPRNRHWYKDLSASYLWCDSWKGCGFRTVNQRHERRNRPKDSMEVSLRNWAQTGKSSILHSPPQNTSL